MTWSVQVLPAMSVDEANAQVNSQFTAAGFVATDFTGERFFSFGGTAFTVIGGDVTGFEKGDLTVLVKVGADPNDIVSADYSVKQALG
ncbi:hypothetical protein [Subtercola vilae]|uniref:hypothetical protein n=1 Tax=Subtercola vilae TaxID=2056433 RepID=UPI0010A9A237|nr:hypothetical protein [Subtercola vilae]